MQLYGTVELYEGRAVSSFLYEYPIIVLSPSRYIYTNSLRQPITRLSTPFELAMAPPTNPPQSSSINYESRDAKEDSEYQVHFTNFFAKGSYQNSSTYQKAVVLLLSWKNNSNNLPTDEEVKGLKAVFEDTFHYQTESAFLDHNTGTKLQLQLNSIVATFVCTHSGPHTLLIVYYAGHGRPGSYYGELELIDGHDTRP